MLDTERRERRGRRTLQEYTIEVSGLPPTLNTFYSSPHWTKRVAAKNEWLACYFYAIKQAKIPALGKISLEVIEECKSHLRDADAAVIAAKFFLDALVDAEILEDDSPEFVESITLLTKKGAVDKTFFLIRTV